MKAEDRFLKEYENNVDAVFRFCYFKLSNKELAQDVTQESWSKTWIYITSGKEIENIKAFVFKVAKNLIVDQYRKQKTFSLDNMMEDGFELSFDERSMIEDKEEVANILQVLNKLPVDHREIVLMRFLEELSIKEIAEIIGDSPNNISVKIHRIMKDIRTKHKDD